MRSVPQLIAVQIGDSDPIPIGFRQGDPGAREYLLDFMGDGLLDHSTSIAIVPYWVLYKHGGNAAPRDSHLLLLMDFFVEGQNTPGNPYRRGGSYDEIMNELQMAARDPDFRNRDIAFHLYFSMMMGNLLPEQVYYSWMYLGSRLLERFGLDHPLPAVESIRYSYLLGRKTETREWIRFLQRIRRGLVAAQIYDVLTEDDPELRERKRSWVINRNPDHWWVESELE